ncbi:hypothetical protein DFH09DRAFT_1105053 [Mycena vulgaris]|nr:hypothetical protein DFH09DRAFT_1105053 [Mycena vulgaris]
MSDQCARDANGNLKDASDIDFYGSESDTKALPQKTTELRRGTRKRDTDKLAKSLAAEKADDDGNPLIEGTKRSRAKAPRIKAIPESVSDQEDTDFELPDLIEASDSEGSHDQMDIHCGKRKQTSDSARAPGINKPNQPTVEVVDDEDGTPTKPANTRNPINLFYELVPKNSVGYAGAPGDKHYVPPSANSHSPLHSRSVMVWLRRTPN